MREIALLAVILALAVVASGCGAADDQIASGPFDIGMVSGNEFGIGFALRNNSDHTLFFTGDFRLYRQENGHWVEESVLRTGSGEDRLSPYSAAEFFIQWWREMPPGHYRFVRPFYTDPGHPDRIEELSIEFDVTHWSDPPAYDWRQDRIDFITAGQSSEKIVPVGEVRVSANAISLEVENRTDKDYIYGEGWELAYYADGRWRAYLPGHEFGWVSIGYMLESGATSRSVIEIGRRFGELPPGRYMLIRGHSVMDDFDLWRDVYRRQFIYEYIMIDFTIDETTPTDLRAC
ncbi:MAG: hypothetical protein FWE32_05360 [Oscillospiraceae bacterium]|nr:hypothetical protein [Oscillospiraceae bacterium]